MPSGALLVTRALSGRQRPPDACLFPRTPTTFPKCQAPTAATSPTRALTPLRRQRPTGYPLSFMWMPGMPTTLGSPTPGTARERRPLLATSSRSGLIRTRGPLPSPASMAASEICRSLPSFAMIQPAIFMPPTTSACCGCPGEAPTGKPREPECRWSRCAPWQSLPRGGCSTPQPTVEVATHFRFLMVVVTSSLEPSRGCSLGQPLAFSRLSKRNSTTPAVSGSSSLNLVISVSPRFASLDVAHTRNWLPHPKKNFRIRPKPDASHGSFIKVPRPVPEPLPEGIVSTHRCGCTPRQCISVVGMVAGQSALRMLPRRCTIAASIRARLWRTLAHSQVLPADSPALLDRSPRKAASIVNSVFLRDGSSPVAHACSMAKRQAWGNDCAVHPRIPHPHELTRFPAESTRGPKPGKESPPTVQP